MCMKILKLCNAYFNDFVYSTVVFNRLVSNAKKKSKHAELGRRLIFPPVVVLLLLLARLINRQDVVFDK